MKRFIVALKEFLNLLDINYEIKLYLDELLI